MCSAHGFSATITAHAMTTATTAHSSSFVRHPLISLIRGSIFPRQSPDARRIAGASHRVLAGKEYGQTGFIQPRVAEARGADERHPRVRTWCGIRAGLFDNPTEGG